VGDAHIRAGKLARRRVHGRLEVGLHEHRKGASRNAARPDGGRAHTVGRRHQQAAAVHLGCFAHLEGKLVGVEAGTHDGPAAAADVQASSLIGGCHLLAGGVVVVAGAGEARQAAVVQVPAAPVVSGGWRCQQQSGD
jgi:hypothetical protein